MEEFQTKHYSRHSWWRILLIITAFLSFILTCIFNGLASRGPNGMSIVCRIIAQPWNCLFVFRSIHATNRTSEWWKSNRIYTCWYVSLILTRKTKLKNAFCALSGWTFSIWGIIYFWQAAWLIYAISRIPRKSNIDYLYIHPNTLHFTVFIIYIINMVLNIIWLVVWDRGYFGVSICIESNLFQWFGFVLVVILYSSCYVYHDYGTNGYNSYSSAKKSANLCEF